MMLRTQIYLPQNQLFFMKKKATQENITLSELIRRCLKEKIIFQEEETFQKKINAGEWFLSLAQTAKDLKIKGPKNLSQKIDEFVYA